jgi:uncharacterized heparinase superfamily protein
MLQMLVPPLLALVHGDGGLGNWQGAGAVSAASVAALVEASGVRTPPAARRAPVGLPARQLGQGRCCSSTPRRRRWRGTRRHGCASTLAFELSHGSQRIVVNCGGAAFAGGQVPVRIEQGPARNARRIRRWCSATANSTAVLVAGKLGAGVGEVEVDRRTLAAEGGGSATRLEASHDGYVGRFGLVTGASCLLRDDGTELRGEDLLIPAGRKGKQGKVPYAVRFHLGPRGSRRRWRRTAAAQGWRCPTAATGTSSPGPAGRSSSTRASGSTATVARSRCTSWSCRGSSRAAAAVSLGS